MRGMKQGEVTLVYSGLSKCLIRCQNADFWLSIRYIPPLTHSAESADALVINTRTMIQEHTLYNLFTTN